MKSLVIDAAASCMTIAAKNDEFKASLSLDLGQKQSQKLLPAIDYVLSQVELKSSDLDYTALTAGPGTFTGLRLAFSALKAIELAANVPVYGVPTLDVYAYPFCKFDGMVVSVIDAKKDQYFAAVYEHGTQIMEPADTTADFVYSKLSKDQKILLAGPDAGLFAEELKKIDASLNLVVYSAQPLPTEALFSIAEEMIEQKKEPLADYDGPVYLRKSEAEIKLESQK
ncbi:tRNA (adenosine(37)-N6)-threonylcarbamoyltransferase complex dimerization subunit type 1 TsaB [uncultured Treponema sp.]|uniref:tRNA (adenosine(37)-N6)-threonylcarbamoyltransferase complex dimerization subunit type 1 TsaB n=1 Tax=uncultured Treponema sp. TaxID=162155 RepID=UPI0025E8CFFC|nr:tRNA (adenosine(37)-N6)-threonylcarbamoyltransferase complex dimerization subunit type 1 TsaB [uncultured Treponema sp.]